MPEGAGRSARAAEPDDLRHLVRLRRQWAEEQAGRAIVDSGFETALAEWWAGEQHQRRAWLGFGEGSDEPVGMLNLMVFTRMPRPVDEVAATAPPRRWGYVANVYVAAAHRNRGIGAEMLAACCAWADDEGFARVVLNPSERSVPLYARAGFAPATSLMVRHLDS